MNPLWHNGKQNLPFCKKNWPWLAAAGFIGLALFLYFLVPAFQTFIQETWAVLWSKDEEKITQYFKEFGFWGPFFIVLLSSIQMFLIVIPNSLMMVVSVLAYGPVWGSVISIIGNIIASLLGYFVGSIFGPKAEKIFGEEKIKKMHSFLEEYGFGAVVMFHLSPFISNDIISVAAGIGKMNFWKFMLATLTGAIPLTIAIAYFGKDSQTLETGLYWIGGGGLVVYALYVWLDHRRKAAQKKK